MTISDLDLARACVDTYDPSKTATWFTEDVHAFLSMQDGCAIIAFQGTSDIQGWFRDFDAFVVDKTFDHTDIGLVHAGFADDVLEIIEQIVAGIPSDPIAITGHSKGAAEALIAAALIHIRKPELNIIRVSTFGTPHTGALKGLLTGIAGADYRNCSDPVCAVPPYLPHARTMTDIHIAPLPDDPWGLFAAHHILLYAQGVTP